MRKFYRLGISMLLLLAATLPAAFAYNFQSGGIYYDITGTSPNTVAVTYATGSYNSYSGNVVIPSTVTYNGTTYTVTAIGNNAFRNCSNLTGVTIPGTVTSIGAYAFYYCWNLHSVDFPDALTSIGAYAFQQSGFPQGGLYSVTIPAAVVTIGTNAFGNCTSMTSVVFNATNCTSAPEVFKDCSHLNSLTIGNTVHKIPNNAFAYCTALKSLYIPSSVSSIEGNPFHHCTSLDTIIVASDNSVYSSGTNNNAIINVATHTLVTGCKSTIIPSSVTAIGAYAFSGSALTSLTIGPNVDSIGNSAFRECYLLSSVSFNADSCKFMGESGYSVFYSCNSLSSLLIGNNVKAIPAYAFNGCSHLTGMLIIPNSVKTIRNNAFYGCNGLTSLSIGNSVASIGSSAFYGCNSMEGTLTIPQSLKSIGSSAFYNCTGFTSLVFNADSCIVGSFSGCSNVSSLTIGNNVKMIPENAFNGLTHLTGVLTIPNAVVTIGNSAFKNCSGLTALTIGNAVATIGQSAFQGCSGLTSLTMGDAVTTIGKSAFQDCSGLSSLTIGDAVTTIGQSAFQGCSGLTFLIMGDAVTKIGQSAFQGCSRLTSLTVGSAVTTIGQSAFQNCYSINGTLIIPDVVRSISNMAFSGCGGIDTIIIGRSVDTIGYEAFKDCNSLAHIVFRAESCAKIGAGNNYEVFTGCVNPATLEIGNNVKIVPHHLFKNFTGLSGTVIIPDSVNNIGTYSFDGCSNIDSLVIGKSVSSIGDYAFRNCSNLSYVEFNADSCISAGHYDGNYNNIYGVFGNGCSHQTNLAIGSNVRTIPSCIFAYFTGISGKVTIPDSVKNIGRYAFYGCNNIDTLVIGHAVTSIGESVFNNCSNLSFVAFYADSCVSMGSTFTGANHPASLYIGDNVKAIPSNAFRYYTGISGNVVIPNSVKTIGSNAFQDCSGLASLTIGDSVRDIGASAFDGCSGLDTLVIGRGVKTIGALAFQNCTGITHIKFNADSCTTIYYNGNYGELRYAFYGCTNPATLTIGEHVRMIPENCFKGYTGLTGTLIIPDSVKTIGRFAFYNCSGIDTLTIGRGVRTISNSAFKNCSGLAHVNFNADSCASLPNYSGDIVFSGCTNPKTLSIGEHVKFIPDYAFQGLTGSLTGSLIIPDSVSAIGAAAFSGSAGLTGTLIISDFVKTIGGSAFLGCSGIDTLTIGREVKTIGNSAFQNCTGLSHVNYNADSCISTPNYYYPFSGCTNPVTLVVGEHVKYIPDKLFCGLTGLTGSLTIPDSVVTIGASAFFGCTGMTSLTIGRRMQTIGNSAFLNCNSIAHVDFNADSCLNVNNAFTNSASITSLSIGENVKYIPDNLFKNCSNITGALIIPKFVKFIGNSAFYNCTGLSSIAFNADSCTNASNAFSGTSLTSLSIGENVKHIPSSIFSGCSGLTGILTIPDSVIVIGNYAFFGCTGLDTLVLGHSVATIGNSAFHNCTGLVGKLNIPNSVTEIGSYAFSGCGGLGTLIIGNSVVTIGDNSFYNCTGLSGTLKVPNSVTSIGLCSFAGCNGLDTLIIGKSVQTINYQAFGNCTGLIHVVFNADSCTTMTGFTTSNYYDRRALKGCTNISSLTIGENVKNIPAYAFSDLNQITGTLIIPDSVVAIRTSAFSSCSGLTSLSLGRSVDSIGSAAFSGCTGLSSITSYNVTPPVLVLTSTHPFSNISRNIPIYVPCGSAQAYRNAWPYSTNNTASYFYNIYETLQTYLLTALPEDTLKGSVQIATQPTCTSPAVIEATPNFFYVFDHWSDGNTDNPRTLTLTQDTTLVAYFREYALNINYDTTHGHIVFLQAPTPENPQAVIEVVPDRCYLFGNWTDYSQFGWVANWSYDNPRTIMLTQDTTMEVSFRNEHPMFVTGKTSLCEGDSTVLKGVTYSSIYQGTIMPSNYLWIKQISNGSDTYSYDTLGLNDSIIVSTAGIYLVTGTDSTGCVVQSQRSVVVHSYPTMVISGETDICEGDSTTITAGLYEFTEDFTNGIPTNWTITGNTLEIYNLYSGWGNAGNAILFPAYNLPENTVAELTLPNINLKQFDIPHLRFKKAYAGKKSCYYDYDHYEYNGYYYDYLWVCDTILNEELKVMLSTDEGISWTEIWNSGSYWNALTESAYYPTYTYYDPYSSNSHPNIDLSMFSDYENVKIKFVFTGGQGNNMWFDDVQVYSSGCQGTWFWSNDVSGASQIFDSTGTWGVTFANYIGSEYCFSTDSVTITVWQPSDTTEITVNTPESYYVMNGETFCTSGDYTLNLQNVHGCDSVVILHLTVTPHFTVVNDTVFGRRFVSYNGSRQQIDGRRNSYQYKMTPDKYAQWADSVLTMWTEWYERDSTSIALTYDTASSMAAWGYTYVYDYRKESGSVVSQKSIYLDASYIDSVSYEVSDTLTFLSSFGCDSSVIWKTLIYFKDNVELHDLEECNYIWQGDSIYYLNSSETVTMGFASGDTLKETGKYRQNLKNVSGCDSTVFWYYTIRPTAYEEITEISCDNYTLNGVTYTESGDYVQNIDTTLAITRNIIYHAWSWGYWNSQGSFIQYRPDGWSYLQTHYDSETGIYTYSYTDQYGVEHPYIMGDTILYTDTVPGCSVTTLHLTINPSVTELVEATACDFYTWNDSTYTTSGEYIQTFTAANGCDSVVTLHLTVNSSVTEFVEATACDSYLWNDSSYTVSGDYTKTFTAANGCDSTVTLHLTINHPVTELVEAAACDSYGWNGQTYTQSGDYVQTFTAANGCDSVVTLHLTVNDTKHVEFSDSTCTAYTWNGQTYASSGDYTQTFTAANGCDSLVTLHLTIVPTIMPVISVTGSLTACDNGSATLSVPGNYGNFVWSTGALTPTITVSEAGYYWVTATDAYGCEGVSEMVQLGGSTQIDETPAICMVDVEDSHNLLIWEELSDPDVASYHIYRENNQANVFEPLAVIPAGSVNAFADSTADPSVRAWRYKITAADTCGGETPMSGYHKTVHLTINQGLGNSWNLIWTPYDGLEFASYKLYRGTANNNLQLIQTMPAALTSYTDNNPSGDALFYQIEVVMTEGCVQHTRDITHTGARSNIVYNQVPVMAEETVSACESYDWDGQTLTSSGDYTQTFVSELGYDSVVTLHLTIHHTPVFSISGNLAISQGQSTALSVPNNAGWSYLWNTGETASVIIVAPSETTSYSVTVTEGTCNASDSVTVTVNTGIDDHDGFDFTVYPNPTTNIVNVQCTMYNVQFSGTEIHIVDMYGKLVRTKPFDGETTLIDISDLANGIYFVKAVADGNVVAVRKVEKR